MRFSLFPLSSLQTEIREVIVDNESNLEAWRGARKAVQALGLTAEVRATIVNWILAMA